MTISYISFIHPNIIQNNCKLLHHEDDEIIYICLNKQITEINHQKIKIIDKNLDLNSSLKKAILETKNNFIKFIDEHFIWDKNFISNQINELHLHPEASLHVAKIKSPPNVENFNNDSLGFSPIYDSKKIIDSTEAAYAIINHNKILIRSLSQCLFRKENLDIHNLLTFNDIFLGHSLETTISLNAVKKGSIILSNIIDIDYSCINQTSSKKINEEERIKLSLSLKDSFFQRDFSSIDNAITSLINHFSIIRNLKSRKVNSKKINDHLQPYKNIKLALLSNDCSHKKQSSSFIKKISRKDFLKSPQSWDWVICAPNYSSINISCEKEFFLEIINNKNFNVIYCDYFIETPAGFLEAFFLETCNHDSIVSSPMIYNQIVVARSSIFEKKLLKNHTEDLELINYQILLEEISSSSIHGLAHLPIPLINVKKTTTFNNDKYLKTAEQYLNHSYKDIIFELKFSNKKNNAIYFKPRKKNHQKINLIVINSDDKNNTLPRHIKYPHNLPIFDLFNIDTTYSFSDSRNISTIERFSQSTNDITLVIDKNIFFEKIEFAYDLISHLERTDIGAVSACITDINEMTISGGFLLGVSHPTKKIQDSIKTSFNDHIYSTTSNFQTLTDLVYATKTNYLISFISDFHSLSSKDYFNYLTQNNKKLICDHICVANFSKNHIIPTQHIATPYTEPNINPNFEIKKAALTIKDHHHTSWSALFQTSNTQILSLYKDRFGCGFYRIIGPSQAINNNLLANSSERDINLDTTEFFRNTFDSIILQCPVDRIFFEKALHFKKLKNTFKVAEIDDNYLDIHINHPLYRKHDKEIIEKNLHDNLLLVDKLIVSTNFLKERYSCFHNNIQVVRNKLPTSHWLNIKTYPIKDRKPRIGWAGGSSHHGDLSILNDVIRHFKGKVTWVFFGMCPQHLLPYIDEFYAGVPLEEYPQALADLDLDLALAPLEENNFNLGKSDLRLLEYGACSFPIICSNVGPYASSDLPVTKVNNKYHEWIDAIEDKIKNIENCKKEGYILRENIVKNYFIDYEASKIWLEAWTS